jgi:bla regulator protein blaR1
VAVGGVKRKKAMGKHARVVVGLWMILAVGAGRAVIVGAQSSAADVAKLPSFEVASVKPNVSGDGRVMLMQQPGGRLNLVNVPLRLLIRNAYRVQDSQIAGGPDWLGAARFDIVAKAENPNASVEELQLMTRSLLADRFKLVMRSEKREMPIYAMVPVRSDGKLGPQLHKSDTDCGGPSAPPAGPPAPGQIPRCAFTVGFGNVKARGTTLPALATTLSTFAGRIVVDRTALTGGYDVELAWTPDQTPRAQGDQPPQVNGAPIDPNGPSLFTALQEQLGLKLESTRDRVDVLVVERAEKPVGD